MAAGNITFLNVALPKILNAEFDLTGSAFNLVLTTSAQALSASFTGTSGTALYSDLTAEVPEVGTQYDQGGKLIDSMSITLSGGVALVTAGAVTWPGAAFETKYGVICLADVSGDPADIIAFFDMETTEPDGRIASGDFMVNFPDGLFDLKQG